MNHKTLAKPDMIGIDEDKFYGFSLDDLKKHYDEMYDSENKWRKLPVRIVFHIVLLSNKNMILILAGSLASIPVNILTSFYGSTSFTCFDWSLHILQLVVSVLFYIFFLKFVGHYLYIREREEEYVNSISFKNKLYSISNMASAVHNIEYYACRDMYKSVRNDLMMLSMFVIVLAMLLLIPPNVFRCFL